MNAIFTMLMLRPYVFGFLIAFLLLAIRLWGWRRTLAWLFVGYAISWGSEALSIRTGFPYGWYFYKYDNLTRDILVAGVPLWDSLSYTFLIFAGFTAAQYAFPKKSALWQAFIGAAATMLLDIMIDPVANLGHLWFLGSIYYYPNGGQHFGVPISNYLGWFFTAWVVILAIAPNRSTQKLNWLYPAFYLAIGIFNTLIAFWIGATSIALINCSILLACLLLFWRGRVS